MLSNNMYIHFALEKEIGEIAILKKHVKTLHYILNNHERERNSI